MTRSNNAALPANPPVPAALATESWAATDWSAHIPPGPEPDSAVHGRTLADLGLVYLRHNAAPRALVLGLSALAMGDKRPSTVLMLAEAMLRAGDPSQSLSVLSRFDTGAQLSPLPRPEQQAAALMLRARALFRQGETEAARAALAEAAEMQAKGL